MHPSVLEWVERTLKPIQVVNKRVIEVGSYDVNGSVRPFVESMHPAEYVGVDQSEGPGVDVVVNCEHLTDAMGYSAWHLVISTEMLEHVRDWRRCTEQLADAVAVGGLLLITTRSPGFPYHAYPEDHWRYTLNDMSMIYSALGMEKVVMEKDHPDFPGVLTLARKVTDEPCGQRLRNITVTPTPTARPAGVAPPPSGVQSLSKRE